MKGQGRMRAAGTWIALGVAATVAIGALALYAGDARPVEFVTWEAGARGPVSAGTVVVRAIAPILY